MSYEGNFHEGRPVSEEEYNRLAEKLNIKRSTLKRWLDDADKNMPLSGSNFY